MWYNFDHKYPWLVVRSGQIPPVRAALLPQTVACSLLSRGASVCFPITLLIFDFHLLVAVAARNGHFHPLLAGLTAAAEFKAPRLEARGVLDAGGRWAEKAEHLLICSPLARPVPLLPCKCFAVNWWWSSLLGEAQGDGTGDVAEFFLSWTESCSTYVPLCLVELKLLICVFCASRDLSFYPSLGFLETPSPSPLPLHPTPRLTDVALFLLLP